MNPGALLSICDFFFHLKKLTEIETEFHDIEFGETVLTPPGNQIVFFFFKYKVSLC